MFGFMRRRVLGSGLSAGRIGLAAAGTLAVVGLVAAVVCGPPGQMEIHAAIALPTAPVSVQPEPDRWIELPRTIEAFSLSSRTLAVGSSYRGERNPGTEGRRDTITFGSLAFDEPYIAVSIVRQTSPDGRELGDTALRLTGGTASRATDPVPMKTKFGDMASAELTAGPTGRARSCVAFGRHEEALRLAIQGIYCASPGKPADRRVAACTIDRLDLVGAGDVPLRSYFVAAEKRRNFCGSGDLRASGTRRAGIEPGSAMPPLRSPR